MSPSHRLDRLWAPISRRALGLLACAALVPLSTALQASETAEDTLDQALRDQSRFLAIESQRALEAWNPDQAIRLALKALPGPYGGDRPLVPEAQIALNRAVQLKDALKQVEVEVEPQLAVLSPNSNLLAVVPKDDTVVEVFDVTRAERVLYLEHDDVLVHAAFSQNDRLLATLAEDGLRLWETESGNQIAHYGAHEADHTAQTTVQTTADDKGEEQSLSSVFESLKLQAVDLPQIGGSKNSDQRSPLVAFSPDDALIAFASERGGVEIRRVENGERLHKVDIEPKLLYFTDTGDRIMVLDGDNEKLLAVDVASGQIETVASDVVMSQALDGAPDIRLGGVENGHLILFDAAGERHTEIKTASLFASQSKSEDPPGSLRSSTLMAVAPEMVAGGTTAGVMVWSLEWKVRMEHFRGGKVTSLAVAHKGGHVAAGMSTGEVQMWDSDVFGSFRKHVQTQDQFGHDDQVVFVGFGADDQVLLSLAADRTLTFRQLRTQNTRLFEWQPSREATAVLSRDGRLVGKYEERLNTLTVWDARTGQQIATINKTMQPPSDNSFHPEKDQLLISDRFTTVLGEVQPGAEVYELESGEPIDGTDGRQGVVHQSIYTMGGKRIITAATGDEPSFSTWKARNGRLLKHVDGERLLAASWLGSRVLTRAGDELILRNVDGNRSITLTTVDSDLNNEDIAAEFDDHGQRVVIRQGIKLTLWDTQAREIVDTYSAPTAATHFGINQDGSRWFAVVDGRLMVREGGQLIDQFEVDDKNPVFAMADGRVLAVTLRGSLVEVGIPEQVSVDDAIARLAISPSD